MADQDSVTQAKTDVKELIGRYTLIEGSVTAYRDRARIKTIDETRPDYKFYDELRRGKAQGYSLGALFCRRIEGIFTSWVLGRGVEITLKNRISNQKLITGEPVLDPIEYTNSLLNDFLDTIHNELAQIYRDLLGLGDQFVIINTDGSITVPSPDTVMVERNPFNHRVIEKITIDTRNGKFQVLDEYTASQRTVTIKEPKKDDVVMVFENLLGEIPIVHLTHGRSANETNGHSIHEGLRVLYDEYDDLIYKQLDGAKLLGNPLLAFVGMEDINAVKDANEPVEADEYTDKDGNTAYRQQLNVDSNSILLVGKGGDAKFVAPPTGFTRDTTQALTSLFHLLLDHTGIPEFIWGNELSSARASAEIQMVQWIRDIESRRKEIEYNFIEICRLWLATKRLMDPRVIVDSLKVSWPLLTQQDEDIRLRYLEFAKNNSLLSDATALKLLNLVDNPEDEVEIARKEAEERANALLERMEKENEQRNSDSSSRPARQDRDSPDRDSE